MLYFMSMSLKHMTKLEAPVHEHGGENCDQALSGRYLSWDKNPVPNELLPIDEFQRKHENVDPNDERCDQGKGAWFSIHIAKRYHGGSLSV